MRTWRFPDFSALLMALSASLRTLVLTMLADVRFSARWQEVRYLCGRQKIHISLTAQRVPLGQGSSVHVAARAEREEHLRSMTRALKAWNDSYNIPRTCCLRELFSFQRSQDVSVDKFAWAKLVYSRLADSPADIALYLNAEQASSLLMRLTSRVSVATSFFVYMDILPLP